MQMLEVDLEEMEEEGDQPLTKDLMFDPWAAVPEETMESHVGDAIGRVYAAP